VAALTATIPVGFRKDRLKPPRVRDGGGCCKLREKPGGAVYTFETYQGRPGTAGNSIARPFFASPCLGCHNKTR